MKTSFSEFSEKEIMIAERKLPRVFYMHPITSGAIIGKPRSEDMVVCNTYSRATTGLHYVLVINGNGEILFEKIMKAGEDWDILMSEKGEIVLGGAHTKTTIKYQK